MHFLISFAVTKLCTLAPQSSRRTRQPPIAQMEASPQPFNRKSRTTGCQSEVTSRLAQGYTEVLHGFPGWCLSLAGNAFLPNQSYSKRIVDEVQHALARNQSPAAYFSCCRLNLLREHIKCTGPSGAKEFLYWTCLRGALHF